MGWSMLHRAVAALFALLVVCLPRGQAQDRLSLDNFKDRYTAQGLAGIAFGAFDCGPDIFDRNDTFCFNEVEAGTAHVFYRGSTASRRLTYVSVLVYNPNTGSQYGLFLGLGIRTISTLSPELSADAMMRMLTEIIRFPNSQRRIGEWVYRIERQGLNVALHAHRK
jgi:hypothetical protein